APLSRSRLLFPEPLDHQREGKRRRAGQQAVNDALAAHARERGAQPLDVEFLLEDLALRLSEQTVVGVVLAEHLVEQAGARLQLLHRLRGPRISLEGEAGHARDFAESPQRECSGVKAGEYVFQQSVLTQQRIAAPL